MIRATFVLGTLLSASVAASTLTATIETSSGLLATAERQSTLIFKQSVLPLTNLPTETVTAIDSPSLTVNKGFITDETVTLSESIDQFDIQLNKTDSVTMVESRVKVFTDEIDFDPSDDDVDATPVTITESAAIDVTIAELADNDDVTVSESIVNNPTKPGITASVTTSEAVDQFRPHKNITDTATASEAIDRFDVTTEFDDTVTATESLVNDFTLADPNDSVTVVQSNIKAFTSNVDFDLSDADVDPDPVTATDVISEFDFNKGLTDTSSITEATAKNFTHGGLSDTASPTESAAFDVTVPGFADSLTAVEGIKLEPDIILSDTASPAESAVLNIQPAFSHSASVTESISTILTLGESTYQYPNRIYALDNDNNPSSIRGYHRGLGESGRAFVQDVFRFGSDGREEFVGLIGGAGLLNDPQMNNDTITYGDSTNAGLLVNFIYTDTDDTELNGHFLNETPLSAGRHT